MTDTFTGRGWRCEPCFHEGKLRTTRDDSGTQLNEDDRCRGCGEVICARHPRSPQTDRHEGGWSFHTETPRVTVTEVA